MSPLELQKVLSSGLLSFPVTDFKANGDLDTASYAKRLEWLAPHGASVLFAAGGTGEFFSLEPKEYSSVIQTAVDTCNGLVPILAGAGGPTRVAIQYAQEAERLGAKGILLLPHYLLPAMVVPRCGGGQGGPCSAGRPIFWARTLPRHLMCNSRVRKASLNMRGPRVGA
jgi:5-dehydro-4-deoxyglucarate dehydratase